MGANVARIVYAIMRTGEPFHPEPGKSQDIPAPFTKGTFTITERKQIKQAKRQLERVAVFKDLGPLAKRASYLADALDKMLREN